MKRLLTLMLACAAVLVMGITAATVSARDGSDDNPTSAQPCDVRQGDNETGDDHGTDSRAVASDNREGTSGNDDQNGTSRDDDINGESGDDDERGGSGDDDLNGDAGDDDLCGDDGNDQLNGGPGNDVLKGGRGRDTLVGGKGNDDLEGDAGNDTINSRDGQRDVVTCGRGFDRVRADSKDRVSGTCESVKRS